MPAVKSQGVRVSFNFNPFWLAMSLTTLWALQHAAVEALKSLYKQKGPAVIAIVEKASATLDAAVNKAANAAIEVIHVVSAWLFRVIGHACHVTSVRLPRLIPRF
jgi:hypothetical protein